MITGNATMDIGKMLRNVIRQQRTTPVQSQISRTRLRKRHITRGGRGKTVLEVFEVRVKIHTEIMGTATTATAHTYDIYPRIGDLEGLAPISENVAVIGRADAGQYAKAADGTFAIAVQDPSIEPGQPGEWLIVKCDEHEVTTVCNAAGGG